MTAFAFEQAVPTTVVAQLGACTEDLAALVGGCLVESAEGRVVAQRLAASTVPPAVLTSLLEGHTHALHASLVRPRTTTLLPSGPVVEGVLREGGARVAHVRLRHGGAVWLLPDGDQPLGLEHALSSLSRLDELLLRDADSSEEVAPWLEGEGPVPAALGPGPWRLARLEGPGQSAAGLLRRVGAGIPVRHLGRAYLVLARAEPPVLPEARVVVAAPTDDLVSARRQVDAALRFVALGDTRTVADVRSAAVLEHLADALGTLPELGADPLGALLEHDERRGTDFTAALRAWLDAGCDVVGATERLGVHSNTLRYRLRRAWDLLGTDLRDDPGARLEIHLRLATR